MQKLVLRPNLTGWQLYRRRMQDKAFSQIERRVYQRDQYTCQYCGFRAESYQSVVNIDGDYRNNKLSNMMTACPFCVQCVFLQAAGTDGMSGGRLIFMNEMSQAELNSFCHVLYCAMDNNTEYQETAQSIYRSLKFRSQPIENQFGTGMSDPAVMGRLMIEYHAQKPEQALHFLKDVRLLPSVNDFKVQLEAWAKDALAELSTELTSSSA